MQLPDYHLEIIDNLSGISAIWHKFDAGNNHLACGYPAVRAWYENINGIGEGDAVIIIGRDKQGSLLFLLPLVRQNYGPFKVLTRPAMRHLAYYRGIFSPEFERQINMSNGKAFWQDVLSCVKDIDALWIDGMCEKAAQRGHPMSHLDYFTSSNPCHIMVLEEDWDAQYIRITSSKKRSNDRRMVRLINEVGEYKFRVAETIEDKIKLLQKLFAQKQLYFESTGQQDPFASADVRKFYEKMLRIDHENNEPRYIIGGIYAGDELMASILGGRQGHIFHGMIISRTIGVLTKYSPGRLLLIEFNKYLSSIGIRAHNFGTGEFDYKNGWCGEVMNRRHLTFALTNKGQVFVKLLRVAAGTKKMIKDGKLQHHPVVGKMRTAFGI